MNASHNLIADNTIMPVKQVKVNNVLRLNVVHFKLEFTIVGARCNAMTQRA